MATKTVIPFGPQHPVLVEPIQLKLTLQDEIVTEAIPHIGYVHRGVEKAGERLDYQQDVFLVERICGICSFLHAQCYCQGIEDLLKLEVPTRARFLRVVWGELHRLQSYLLWLGLFADSFGYENLFMNYWRVREMVLDLFEKTCGSRVIISTCAVGGTRRDISSEHLDEILATLKVVEAELKKLGPATIEDRSIKRRLVGKGVLAKEQAVALGAVGPMARASGVVEDARLLGYAAYPEIGFEAYIEEAGDCYARTVLRFRETHQSIELVRRAIEKMPEGDIQNRPRGRPTGRTISRVEQPRGEVFYLIVANGTNKLERLRIRTPTFANIPPMVAIMPGCEFADVPVITVSIDPCISCTER